MSRFQVLLTDYAWPDLAIERRTLADVGADLIVADATDEATLTRQATDADAIMTNWAKVTSRVLAAATKCRIVARTGIGLDNIDVEFAAARGIPVTNVPDYCIREVAEHALALILALGRKVAFYHHETKSGRYAIAAGPPLRRLEGQTLGIVGLGNTGQQLATLASAIGLRVLAYARRPERVGSPAEWAPLDALLEQSDYVSLHLASTPETRHFIGREQLARMKPTAYLINTARGAVLDETALVEALAAERLAGAALDVQEQEPPDLSRPSYSDPRVIVTPHAAFYSLEAVSELRRRASLQVADALTGKTPANVVNAVDLNAAARP
ncbi:MAG TPA: C-terminal binding protein [Pirellulales bacterium]|nr:C-terminal binding protein [Pirellulales bacterium]